MSFHMPEDEGAELSEINTTPLIDVLLVLLVMLIITIPIQTHAVKLDLPDGPPPVAQTPEVVTVEVASSGLVRWNGQPLADGAALDESLRQASTRQPQPELHLSASNEAPYAVVAQVMSSAQRLGVKKVGLMGGG